jgi:hypothetical protein
MSVPCPVYVVLSRVLKLGFFEVAGSESSS